VPHRKPLGTPVTLRSSSWDGPAPQPGDHLVTRAGTWYLVTDVAQGGGPGHHRMVCLRVAEPTEAERAEAAVFRWRWATRHRRTVH
jgi:hypothetical protein